MPESADSTLPKRSSENRSADRRKIRLKVQSTSSAGTSSPATISNLSSTGLLLAADVQFMIGEKILIDLPHTGLTAATVVWAGDGLFGCQFSKAISHAALGAAQLQSPVEAQETPRHPTTTDSNGSLHMRLRRLRKQRGFGVAELAALLAVSKPSIWNWETGKARPKRKNLSALAQALGTSVPELLFGQQSVPKADEHSLQASSSIEAALGRPHGEIKPRDRGTGIELRLGQLIAASKEQIAALAGTDAAKVKIQIEF